MTLTAEQQHLLEAGCTPFERAVYDDLVAEPDVAVEHRAAFLDTTPAKVLRALRTLSRYGLAEKIERYEAVT